MRIALVNFWLLITVLTTNIYALENSVIPIMEQFESLESLPANKFTKRQIHQIEAALDKKAEKIRLVSYNMLFNLCDHNLAEENRWPQRLPRIVELIQEMQPDIIATQELYPSQVADLCAQLDQDFAFFAGHRDEDGESYGIFYRKARFQLLASQVIYPLSMIQLKDLKSNKTFAVFNTHMPFSDIEKRETHADAIVEIIEPYSQQMAVLFTGDLNTFSARLEISNLPFFDGDHIHRILTQGSLSNARDVSLIGHFGPISTFTSSETENNGAPFKGTGKPGIFLDHIYVSNQVIVLAHAIEKGTVHGHFPSDHLPVLIDFLVK